MMNMNYECSIEGLVISKFLWKIENTCYFIEIASYSTSLVRGGASNEKLSVTF